MILWIVKLISTARRAIAGRKYPHQLAWAVAFGLLLGVVPHGNLLALILLVVVLSLKINHAMAALTAIAATFVATKLDPFSHQVGEYVLSNPRINEAAVNAWQMPLVPWTDLNNTVVMGSFLIGVAALLPVFALTYPVFRLFQPAEEDLEERSPAQRNTTGSRQTAETQTYADSHGVVMVDQGHQQVNRPHTQRADRDGVSITRSTSTSTTTESEQVEFVRVDTTDETSEDENRVAVETRIDVIRMKDYREPGSQDASQPSDGDNENQPMDEALNYLLRQLRDSQQRKAA
ncbi:MAG: TIGR03546 family protein [Rubripirellula sp.]